MESHSVAFLFLTLNFVIPSVLGHGSMAAIIQKLQRLDGDVNHLSMQVLDTEDKMINELTLAQQYLEAKLIDTIVPKYIDSKVEASLSGILKGRRIEDMVSGYVVNQLKALRGNLKQMKRQYYVMSRRLEDMRNKVESKERITEVQQLTQNVEDLGRVTTQLSEELNSTRESLKDMEERETQWEERLLMKQIEVTNYTDTMGDVVRLLKEDLNSTRKEVMDMDTHREHWEEQFVKEHQQMKREVGNISEVTTLLQKDLNVTRDTLQEIEKEADRIYRFQLNMNHSHQSLKEELNMTQVIQEQNAEKLDGVDTQLVNVLSEIEKCKCQKTRQSTTLVTASTSTPVTTSITPSTPRRGVSDMDLLIAPHSKDYFKRLNLNKNTLSNFSLSMTNVDSVIFISSVRCLLISDHDPNERLLSFNIDSNTLKTVRENVLSNGMAVDEVRQVVFMTTERPRYTISRMEVNGWGYRVIVNTVSYGGEPYSIAVDPRQRTIYACVSNKLLKVDYDGHNVQTLYTGSNIWSVTLDSFKGLLYFNSDKKLWSKSLSNNVIKEVLKLSYDPYTIVHYNNSIYTLNHDSKQVSVIFLGTKAHNIAENKLQIVKSSYYTMCLIPVVP